MRKSESRSSLQGHKIPPRTSALTPFVPMFTTGSRTPVIESPGTGIDISAGFTFYDPTPVHSCESSPDYRPVNISVTTSSTKSAVSKPKTSAKQAAKKVTHTGNVTQPTLGFLASGPILRQMEELHLGATANESNLASRLRRGTLSANSSAPSSAHSSSESLQFFLETGQEQTKESKLKLKA